MLLIIGGIELNPGLRMGEESQSNLVSKGDLDIEVQQILSKMSDQTN